MLQNKKIGIISLGCDKNRVDSEYILGIIKNNKIAITNNIKDAEIIIINTCAFLNDTRKEAIDTIFECNAYRKDKLEKLIVCGCLSQKYIEEIFEQLPEVDIFLGINDYDRLVEAIELSYQNKRVNFVKSNKELVSKKRVLTTPEHYAYLKIADGCDNKCTYCLIPKIRGSYRSEKMEDLILQAESLGDISELILVAQDITRYGLDLYGKKSLVKLIKELSKLENIKKIRLLYCYPDMIDDQLILELKNNNKLIKYIDIPLQHSENRILKLMNRKGSRKEYLELIYKLKKEVEGIAIRSTFITGFPSETEEEFLQMQNFLKEAKFFNVGFFKYSKEQDTPSYKLKNQIAASEKERRVKELYKLQNDILKNQLNEYVGKEIDVLCDGIDYVKEMFYGRAYFSAPDIDTYVYFNAEKAIQGKEIKVKIDRCKDLNLIGKAKGENYEFTK